MINNGSELGESKLINSHLLIKGGIFWTHIYNVYACIQMNYKCMFSLNIKYWLLFPPDAGK